MIDIYTCITAGYDDLKKQPKLPDARYTAFVEGVTRPLPPWSIESPPASTESDPTRRARAVKVLAHRSLPKAEYSLWVDGCFIIRGEFRVERWIAEYLGDADVATFLHTEHDCTYEHADRVIKIGLDRSLTVAEQMLRYREAGLPEHAGMVQTNVILRRHNAATEAFNEVWWREIQKGSRRDQLSFVYAARETELRFAMVPAHERQYFAGKSHRGMRTAP